MLSAYAIDFQGSWDKHLSLVEFAYNNNFQASISMAPYEALYGKKKSNTALLEWGRWKKIAKYGVDWDYCKKGQNDLG